MSAKLAIEDSNSALRAAIKEIKNNKCDICHDDKFFKSDMVSCYTCNKLLCYKCFIKSLDKIDFIYNCVWCRAEHNCNKTLKLLGKISIRKPQIMNEIICKIRSDEHN
jgi:hypothetical protein